MPAKHVVLGTGAIGRAVGDEEPDFAGWLAAQSQKSLSVAENRSAW